MSGEERDQECLEIEANFLFPGGVLGVKNESDSDTIENNVCVFSGSATLRVETTSG